STGTRSSPIPPSPTPSSTALSTTLTASHSREIACARSSPSVPSLTPPRKPEFNSSCRQRHPGRLRRNRWPPSIGTRDRVQSESPAAIIGIRILAQEARPMKSPGVELTKSELIDIVKAANAPPPTFFDKVALRVFKL